ncbi:hypothetical protein COF09_18335, partial [Bacillus toyonensis]
LSENDKNGGECGWCGEVRSVLKPPYMFDFSLKEKMYKYYWVHDREMFTWRKILGRSIERKTQQNNPFVTINK